MFGNKKEAERVFRGVIATILLVIGAEFLLFNLSPKEPTRINVTGNGEPSGNSLKINLIDANVKIITGPNDVPELTPKMIFERLGH